MEGPDIRDGKIAHFLIKLNIWDLKFLLVFILDTTLSYISLIILLNNAIGRINFSVFARAKLKNLSSTKNKLTTLINKSAICNSLWEMLLTLFGTLTPNP